MNVKIMREILFRGKRTDNGEWVEGYYCNLGGNHPRVLKENIFIGKIGRVLEFKNIDVISETVGQYTGLTDKNGVKIFEGDILRDDDNEENGVIEFVDGEFCVVFGNVETHGIADIACCCYVIGNIHDNPELLETAAKPADKNIAQSTLAPATENFELMEG